METRTTSILDSIKQQAFDSVTVEDVLLGLCAQVEQITSTYTACSYAEHLPMYIALKLAFHQLAKHDNLTKFEYMSARQNKIRAVRHNLYAYPCRECLVCDSRKSKWPDYCNYQIT